jgi:hypothetical protein
MVVLRSACQERLLLERVDVLTVDRPDRVTQSVVRHPSADAGHLARGHHLSHVPVNGLPSSWQKT